MLQDITKDPRHTQQGWKVGRLGVHYRAPTSGEPPHSLRLIRRIDSKKKKKILPGKASKPLMLIEELQSTIVFRVLFLLFAVNLRES